MDYLAFLPLVNFRKYAPSDVGVGLEPGTYLVDDALSGQVYLETLGVGLPAYNVRGGELRVYPHLARANRFWVLAETSGARRRPACS